MTELVVFSLEPWDGIWRRNQYLVDGMLRRDPALAVTFVEPARDVPFDAARRQRPRLGAGKRTHPDYGGRLTLFQPTKWLPRRLGPSADALLRRSLERALHGESPDLVWVNDPGWAGYAADTTAGVLYDITDDWVLADRPPREHDRIVADEQVLLARADAVTVCSSRLVEAKGAQRADVVLVPNAVDVARYRAPAPRPDDLPPTAAVYAGTLHEDRLDVDLIIRTGRALAQVGASIVLLGPDALTETHAVALRAAAGVVMLGPRERDQVPAYLQHAQALVVPHVVDAFTDSLDPIKLYEYRAVGRPVVSTPVAGFREWDGRGQITIAPTGSFPQAVVDAVDAAAPTVAADGVPDWSGRVGEIARVLEQVADRRRSQPDGGPVRASGPRAILRRTPSRPDCGGQRDLS